MMIVAQNAEEMIASGEAWADKLSAGQVIGLVGDLGAGKTHFTKGVVSGLGSEADVTSPTFSLVNEYRDGRIPVFHFDFYRMESVDELMTIGWDEYLYEENGLMIIEWADKFAETLPEETIWCRFSTNDKNGTRSVIIE